MEQKKNRNVDSNHITSDLKSKYTDSDFIIVKCIYNILKKENNLTTKNLLKLAFSSKYEEICKDCASADGIYRGLRLLQEEGRIASKLVKGGYIWQLLY